MKNLSKYLFKSLDVDLCSQRRLSIGGIALLTMVLGFEQDIL